MGVLFTDDDVLLLRISGEQCRKLVILMQGRVDQMSDYIKKLRACIRWYIELEDAYLVEQEKLRGAMDSENARHTELGNESFIFLFVSVRLICGGGKLSSSQHTVLFSFMSEDSELLF